MWFWIFMLMGTLIIPVTMMLFGWLFEHKPPQDWSIGRIFLERYLQMISFAEPYLQAEGIAESVRAMPGRGKGRKKNSKNGEPE